MTPYDFAERFVGIHEIPGPKAHPFLSWTLSLVDQGATPSDEIPNCSAFVYAVAWMLDLAKPSRVVAAAARSWLAVGYVLEASQLARGFDIVILTRGGAPAGPVGPGHVGFFSSRRDDALWLLGANQSDSISLAPFPEERAIGFRRLA